MNARFEAITGNGGMRVICNGTIGSAKFASGCLKRDARNGVRGGVRFDELEWRRHTCEPKGHERYIDGSRGKLWETIQKMHGMSRAKRLRSAGGRRACAPEGACSALARGSLPALERRSTARKRESSAENG